MLPAQDLRIFFVTAVTAQRRRLFQAHANAQLFLDVMHDQRAKNRMEVHSFVLMPNHIHLLLTPAADVSREKAIQYLKGGFSFRLKSKLDVWERGSNDTRAVDREAYFTMKRYIEENPVRARLAEHPATYPWSSAGRPNLVDPVPSWFA